MTRSLLAIAALALLGGCEPDYGEAAGAAPESAHLEVTGGADTAAVSGPSAADSGGTIHHNRADGNAGRAPDRRVPATATSEGVTAH